MAASIKFDNTEIRTTTYLPRYVKHESMPARELSTVALAREDGDIFVASRWGVKSIKLTGHIVGTSQADLESKIDTFKELLGRQEKNLDIDWNGATRRYVASCVSFEIDRDHFHISFAPWTAEFMVSSGEGLDTTTTTPLSAHVVATSTPGADSFSMIGSKPAKASIVIEMGWSGADSLVKGLEYKNTDTGEKIVITRNIALWWEWDAIYIDCLNKVVRDKLGGYSAFAYSRYYGIFPKFQVGTNNVQISLGGLVNQESAESSLSQATEDTILDHANDRAAQSFMVPYGDDTFKGITLAMKKTGSPGNITWRIETDTAGHPSGTLADANATGTIAAAGITGSHAYLTSYAANLWALSANTRYWLVIKTASADGSNYISVAGFRWRSDKYYGNGKAMVSADAGSTYANATALGLVFKIRYGGEPSTTSVLHTLRYTKTYL